MITQSSGTAGALMHASVLLASKRACGVPQGSSLGPPLFYIFTNDLPLALNKACVSMYADDSTVCASATTANEVTETLSKELYSV